MLFSIIVPIYNVKKYLIQCVESILTQTFGDFELILVDDGSTDGCDIICDNYAKLDNRVQVIHKQNGGLVSARKVGVSLAKGEYVLYVDGDDYIEQDLLSKVNEIVAKQSYDMISFQYRTVPHKERKKDLAYYPEGQYDRKHIENYVFPTLITGENGVRFPPSLWGKVFKREFVTPIQNCVPDEVVIGEDSCVVYVAMYLAKSLYVMYDELYCYRVDNESLTRTKKCFSWDEPFIRAEFYFRYIPHTQFEKQVARITVHSLFNVAISVLRAKKYSVAKKEIKEKLLSERSQQAIKIASFRGSARESFALMCLKRKWIFLMKMIPRILV